MSNEMNQGLTELLNYADDTTEEEGQLNTDLDDKSSGPDSEDFASGETTSEGAEEPEGEASQEGEEDGGEESKEVSTTQETDEVAELRASLEEIKLLLKAKQTEAAPIEAPTPKLPDIKPVITQLDLFKDYSFDDLVENEDTFKKWAGEMVAKVQEATQEAIYRNVPQLIQSYTDQQIAVTSQAQQFYKDNPDLVEHKAEVAKNANLIAQADPNLDSGVFFSRVADFTRMQLKLPVKADTNQEAVSDKPRSKPALNKRSSKATSRLTSQPELAGIEKEISDMMEKMET